jgi:hypothetical protein
MDMDYDDFSSVNSELRYLTLELMKIALEKGKSFEEVALEFVKNVEYLSMLIEESASKSVSKVGKRSNG